MEQKPTTDVQEYEISPEVHKLRLAKESGYQYRRRRHNDWTDNYTLYRDKVQLNRLIQRQSVNIPLIKTEVKTLLTQIDDPPVLYFTNLDNDEQAEVFYNEYWKHTFEENKGNIKDIVDKRQVLLFGRSFKKMNIINGLFSWEIIDPQDVLVDRYLDPTNLDSARYVIIEHIYKPLASLRENPHFDTTAVKRIQAYMASNAGLVRSQANQLDFIEKQARMAEMGVIDVFSPQLQETYLELNEFYIKEWDDNLKEDVMMYIVTCNDMEILYKAPLEECVGVTADHYWRSHYPISTWGDETERTDFWNDGVTDILRTPNKILNAWFSQEVENRTLRSFGMQYYNSSMGDEGFAPQTFTPEAWGWYPIPAGDKKIEDMIKYVEVPELEGNLENMEFIMNFAQRASASTTTQEGESQNNVTLGDIKLALNEAKNRVMSMQKYYNDSWKDFGHKYIKLLEASGHLLDEQTIHRKGRLTKKMYTKTISPKDWETNSGFVVEVQMKSERDAEDQNDMQWLNAAISRMPMNPIVDEEYNMRLLENSNMPAEKISEALKYQKQLSEQMQQAQQGQLPQIEAPQQTMNYKDLAGNPSPPQAQMLAEVGIQAQSQQGQTGTPAMSGALGMPQQGQVMQQQQQGLRPFPKILGNHPNVQQAHLAH